MILVKHEGSLVRTGADQQNDLARSRRTNANRVLEQTRTAATWSRPIEDERKYGESDQRVSWSCRIRPFADSSLLPFPADRARELFCP
jgi:hypothetical protein